MSDGELRQLLDERAIRRVLMRYVRGVDRLDLAAVASCYHPDATDLHGTFEGTVTELVAWLGRVLPRYEMSMHHLGHSLVEWDPGDPDRVRVETYGVSVHRSPGETRAGSLLIGFRYLDLFTRRAADTDRAGSPELQWRIQRRVCTTEWIRRDDPAGRFPIDDRFLQGSRDGTDLVQQPWSALDEVHAGEDTGGAPAQ